MAKKQKSRNLKNKANMRTQQHEATAVVTVSSPYQHVLTDLKKTLFLTFFIFALQLGFFFLLR